MWPVYGGGWGGFSDQPPPAVISLVSLYWGFHLWPRLTFQLQPLLLLRMTYKPTNNPDSKRWLPLKRTSEPLEGFAFFFFCSWGFELAAVWYNPGLVVLGKKIVTQGCGVVISHDVTELNTDWGKWVIPMTTQSFTSITILSFVRVHNSLVLFPEEGKSVKKIENKIK